MLIIPSFKRKRQGDCEFEASLLYTQKLSEKLGQGL